MKHRCLHSWKFTKKEPHGEDRVIHHFSCRNCPATKTRNVKKPRYVPQKKTFTKKAVRVPKLRKTLQKAQERKRSGIRPVSEKRKVWLKQYEAKKKADPAVVHGWDIWMGVVIPKSLFKHMAEPHHGLARIGCRILFYAWASPALHKAIHDNPKWARAEGLLLPEYDGRESGPDQKDPLNLLPEYRAYVAEHGLH